MKMEELSPALFLIQMESRKELNIYQQYFSDALDLSNKDGLTNQEVIIQKVIDLAKEGNIKATEKICSIDSSIKVIMLTVFEEPDKIFRAIKAGAAGYVLKNTKPAQLVEQLKTLNRGGAPISPEAAGKLFTEIQKEKNSAGSFNTAADHEAASENDYNLTEREFDVLKAIAEGYNYRETAGLLNISSATVKKHILHIYRKLNVSSRVEFMKKVLGENLIQP